MITNVIMTMVILITTNTYQPRQYKDNGYICYVLDCNQDHFKWVDELNMFCSSGETRINPDVKIEEVHEIRKWVFNLDGQEREIPISDKILSKRKLIRKIQLQWELEE